MATRPLVAAVDIGATKTLVAVRSIESVARGWHVGEEVARTATDPDPNALVAWIGEQVDRQCLVAGGELAVVGVAAPGPLDAVTGIVTRASNLGWQDVPLAPLLRRRLGVPAWLEDDANTAAVGEWRYGAGQRLDPFAYLTLSSGIGGAVVVGGEIVRGASGNAGEVGHLTVDPAGPRCACGRRGDVEAFAGGVALARRARRTWPRRSTSAGKPAPRSSEAVFAAARRGDPDAKLIVEQAANAISVSIAALAATLEPKVVVVGGSVGLTQPRLVQRAATLARRRVIAEIARSLRVERAALGAESVLAGATHLATHALERPGSP